MFWYISSIQDFRANKPGIWNQKFAAGVTKLLPPDEIGRFDSIEEKYSSGYTAIEFSYIWSHLIQTCPKVSC